MGKVTQEGEVYLTESPETLAGRIEKDDDSGTYTGRCALCGDATVGKKKEVVAAVNDHFKRYHTTLA